MVIEATQNWDEDDSPEKAAPPKKNVAPRLDDASAFPDAGMGGARAAAAIPNFAAMASETLPPQKEGLDLSKKLIIKQQRPVVKPRITKVREAYKRDDRKAMGKFTMYSDEGVPAGVSQGKAPCEMAELDKVSTLADFYRSWSKVGKMAKDDGHNIRLFKSDFEEPSAEHDQLGKGGKYQLMVTKALAENMFEELCTYFMDSRLDNAIVGVCWCIRNNCDVLQMWTKTDRSGNSASTSVFIDRLHELLGLDKERVYVNYNRIADVYGPKTNRVKKFYLVEPVDHLLQRGVAAETSPHPQMREFKTKKEQKKGAEGFVEVANNSKPRKSAEKSSPVLSAAAEPTAAGVGAVNNYAGLDYDEGEDAPIGNDVELKEKKASKKSDKAKKGSTRTGSKKDKRKSQDFGELEDIKAPLIPQTLFVGLGLGGVIVVAILAIAMSGIMSN